MLLATAWLLLGSYFGLIFMFYPGKIIRESDKSRDCSQLRLGFIRLGLAGGLLVYYLWWILLVYRHVTGPAPSKDPYTGCFTWFTQNKQILAPQLANTTKYSSKYTLIIWFDLCKRYNFSNVSKSLYPSLTILHTGLWQSLWILKVRKGGGVDTNQFRVCWRQTTNHEITLEHGYCCFE